MSYASSATVGRPFADVLESTMTTLADQGFGILTEIDLAATLRAKIGVEMPDQVILGACRPMLAHAAIQAEPSIGLLLPCNVVVRSVDNSTTLVETMDPDVMVTMTQNEALAHVAGDARERLRTALGSLSAS